MELTEYSVFAERCFRDTPPPCAAVCPLAYDVRDFIRLMRKGSFRSAYKLIHASLVFPSVITKVCPEPCRKSCVRGRLFSAGNGSDSGINEESVDLKGLEQICVEKMRGKDPDRYHIPQKQRHVAVVGAGLSGLACAYRLASFGYQVRVYEKNSIVGGDLPYSVERQWCHDEIMREFKAVQCDFALETEIVSLTEIQAADVRPEAVYIATGEGGRSFSDAADEIFEGLLLRGGALKGADIMEAVRMGLTAAETINNRLLTHSSSVREEVELTIPERAADNRYYDLHYETAVPAEIPEKGVAEAFRCMRCNCSECYSVCPLMEKHKQYPKKICNEMIVTIKPNKSRRTAVRMIMGCTECGACREACPENIDMGRCIQEARTDFYESGAMSPAFHDYWLQDMEFCQSAETRLLKITDAGNPADVLFFPGCQLSASMPELTVEAYKALQRACDNPAVLLACCGVPAKWAGRKAEYEAIRKQIIADWESVGKPLFVTACMSCLQSMKDLRPDMRVVSYYRFAAEHPNLWKSGTGHAGGKVKVIDPCSSVSEYGVSEDIRRSLEKAGYEIINKEAEPACCGFGGHIYNAVPVLHDKFAERRIEDMKGTDVIAASYCANCRDILAYRGADARHVLGMLLGIEEERRQPPELNDRRENRRIVKRYLTGEKPDQEDNDMEIRISEELIRKMDRELILREQVKKVICEAEETGNKIYDEEDNIFIAHKKFGTVTIWTMYSYGSDDKTIMVDNVYYHRMEIRENQ